MATAVKQNSLAFTAEYGDNSFGFSTKGAAVTVLGTGPTKGGKWIEANLSVNGNQGEFRVRGHSDFVFTPTVGTFPRPYQCYKFAYYVSGSPTSQMKLLDVRVGDQLLLYLNTNRRLVVSYGGVEYEASDAGIIPSATEVYISVYYSTYIGTDNRFAHFVVMVGDSIVLSQVGTATTVFLGTATPVWSENLGGGVNRGVSQRFGALVCHIENGDAPWGPLSVARLTPNANGALSEAPWVDNVGGAADYQRWDDASFSTADGDWNEMTGAGPSRLTSALPNLSSGDLPVFVVGRMAHRVTTVIKGQSLRFIAYDGATSSAVFLVVPSTVFSEAVIASSECIMMKNAPDGSTWTLTNLGSLEIGASGQNIGAADWEVGLVAADVAYQPSGVVDYLPLPMPWSGSED